MFVQNPSRGALHFFDEPVQIIRDREMATTPMVADCQVTASSISATDALNACRNWSSASAPLSPVLERLGVLNADFQVNCATGMAAKDFYRQCKTVRPQSAVFSRNCLTNRL